MEFYERFSGARMHTALYKPIIFKKILNIKLQKDILFFCKNFFITINEIHNVLTNNKIWKARLLNNSFYSLKNVISSNLTGVMARCVGLRKDLRISLYQSYNNYKNINFYSFFTLNGDSYDRYLIRIFEMIESVNIITQSLLISRNIKTNKTTKINNFFKNKYMESVIDHFKY
jgi:NADH-quinone oxidoreductase subunit D